MFKKKRNAAIEELFLDKKVTLVEVVKLKLFRDETFKCLMSIVIHYRVDHKCRDGIKIDTSAQNKQKICIFGNSFQDIVYFKFAKPIEKSVSFENILLVALSCQNNTNSQCSFFEYFLL